VAIVLHGHPVKQPEAGQPARLSEVTIQSSPAALREIAAFLLSAADLIESTGQIDHLHLQDSWSGWSDSDGDIIVADPPS